MREKELSPFQKSFMEIWEKNHKKITKDFEKRIKEKIGIKKKE
jgi:hypothetical protein